MSQDEQDYDEEELQAALQLLDLLLPTHLHLLSPAGGRSALSSSGEVVSSKKRGRKRGSGAHSAEKRSEEHTSELQSH